MASEINPYLPDEKFEVHQALEIYMEAFQDFYLKVEKPYVVQGKRQKMHLTPESFMHLMAVLRQTVMSNEKQIQNWLDNMPMGELK